MKAINLVPSDQRRGAGGRAGRSGGGAYVLLGLLALALVLFGAWTYTNKQLKEKQAEAASLQARAAQRASQTAGLGSYTDFDKMRAQRQQTVVQLADSRFDWAHAFGELSRVLPGDVWLSGLTATVAPGVGADSSGGASDPLRASMAVPALELSGCATSQVAVTNLLTQLGTMNGVERVSISKSDTANDIVGKKKSGPTDSAAAMSLSPNAGARVDPCVDPRKPTFSIVVFYKGLIAPPGRTRTPQLTGSAGAPGSAPAPAPGQTAPAAGGASTTVTTPTPTPTTPTPTTAAPAGGSQR